MYVQQMMANGGVDISVINIQNFYSVVRLHRENYERWEKKKNETHLQLKLLDSRI